MGNKYKDGGVVSDFQQLVGECHVETKVPCEVYSRIVGYLRPIQNWNKGKQQEFADRVVYRVPNDLPEAKPRALLVAPFEVL